MAAPRARPMPGARIRSGTRVEVRDLFYATPARLKFLKTPRTEARPRRSMRCERLAMAHPDDRLHGHRRRGPRAAATCRRPTVAAETGERRGCSGSPPIMGRDFADNALRDRRRRARACASPALPACRRSTAPTAQHQYLFVNGRPVRDKLLIGAVRGAYQDFLARDRHPMVALFLDAPPDVGRRQRPSGQDRGALPRCRRWCAA